MNETGMDVTTATVEDFIKLTEMKFKEYAGKVKRTSLEWGEWSVIMNREIRRRIEEKTPDKDKIAMVYQYWVEMSQLLELKWTYKKGFFGKNKIKQKVRHIKQLRDIICEDS